MNTQKIILNAMDAVELTELTLNVGESRYRAGQLYRWLYNAKVSSIDDMSNLPKEFRAKLGEVAEMAVLQEIDRRVSVEDGSVKLLLELPDGERIEAVLLKDGERVTACISTQVGCKMGCVFCTTARVGFKRNLSSAEILEQVRILELVASELAYCDNGRLTNIVVMGMGEPLDNIGHLKRALEILVDDGGYGYSHKRITVSTSGLATRLKDVMAMVYPPNLAISINASNQETRERIMPIAKRYGLDELLAAVRRLGVKRGEKVTFEYVLIKGINDSVKSANELAKLLRGIPCKINLLRYNGASDTNGADGASMTLMPPEERNVIAFQKILIDKGYQAFIRKSLGADIFGACGQLAGGYI